MAHIYKNEHDGTWNYRVYYRDATGKRHSINKSGFKKQSDAKNAAALIEIKKSEIGLSRQNELITFANYFKKWVQTYKEGRYYPNTVNKYWAAEKFIRKHYGSIQLKKVTQSDYQKMLDAYGKDHVTDSVSLLNSYVRTSLRDALDERIINYDFTSHVIIQGKQSNKEIKYFELEEANIIRKFCLDTASMRYITKYEIALAIATGLRYGEVVGLTWDDIDFDKKTVNVNKTYDYIKRTGFKSPKTKSSYRVIEIDDITLNMLRRLKIEQAKLFLKQGYKNKKGYVFINYAHQIPTDNAANKALDQIQTDKEISKDPKLTFHALRHTHASILIANGVSLEYVAARLGHADTVITSKTYIHLLKDRREKDAELAVQIFQ